jgi:hypothetical protein
MKIHLTKVRYIQMLLAGAVAALSLSACGGTAYTDIPVDGSEQNTTSGNSDTTPTDNSGDDLAGGDDEADGMLAPIEWDPVLTGAAGENPSEKYGGNISTESILKVTVSLNPPRVVAGYTIEVGCVKATVKALGYSKTVVVRSENPTNVYYSGAYESSDCTSAKTEATLDFSTYLNSGGNSSVTLEVSNLIYDNCHKYGLYGVYYSGCALNAANYGHEVSLNLQIQTNGTY